MSIDIGVYFHNLECVFQYLDIDECASDPCLNNATCHDQINGYTCNCTDGYNGTHCETGNYRLLSFSKYASNVFISRLLL